MLVLEPSCKGLRAHCNVLFRGVTNEWLPPGVCSRHHDLVLCPKSAKAGKTKAQELTAICCCRPLMTRYRPLDPNRSITSPFWWAFMRENTTTLRMTASSRDGLPSCSMCSKAAPVTQHCASPCTTQTSVQQGKQANKISENRARHGFDFLSGAQGS